VAAFFYQAFMRKVSMTIFFRTNEQLTNYNTEEMFVRYRGAINQSGCEPLNSDNDLGMAENGGLVLIK